MVKNPKFAKTKSQAAAAFGISAHSLRDWSEHPDFPKKTKDGWNIAAIDEWARANNRGKYRNQSVEAAQESGGDAVVGEKISLREAVRRRTVEQAENERIKKELALVEQATQLGDLLLLDDVRGLYLQTASTVKSLLDSFGGVGGSLDRALPESPPSAESWPEIRNRLTAMGEKLIDDAAAAMEGLQ